MLNYLLIAKGLLDEFLRNGDYKYISPERYGGQKSNKNMLRGGKRVKGYTRSKTGPLKRDDVKLSRNADCFCGSGKKYKKCCINK